MTGAAPYSSTMIAVWGCGIVILGVALAFAATRAGRLRRTERERLDRNTEALQRVEYQAERRSAPSNVGLRPNLPYAIIVPIVIVGFALAWMIWSMHGTNMAAQQSATTGRAVSRQTEPPVAAPTAPANDAASDSARGQRPLNKTQ